MEKSLTRRLVFRKMRPYEAEAVSDFAINVFSDAIAESASQAGKAGFLRYADPENIARRQKNCYLILLALLGPAIKGMVELRDSSHISMFFVHESLQRNGIGRELLQRTLQVCRRKKPMLSRLTVNASFSALPAYEHMGFVRAGQKSVQTGIRSIPMVLIF